MNEQALWLIPLLFAVCFGLLTFLLLRNFGESFDDYSEDYTETTTRQLEDIFLYISPKRIFDIAAVAAVVLFILFFFMMGDLSSNSGRISGLFGGTFGAILALRSPNIILRLLKTRRRIKFESQLVDALNGMSNSLRAGFSIQQSIEAIVKEGQNPIAQEFSVFLHQTRVGVSFEQAMEQLVERVGSEDLELMVRAVETARLTGGNLTDVFDKIAATIRERMRLEGRIRALTSQGRMQAWVVGSLPFALFLAMNVIDPQMMRAFIGNKVGIALMAGVVTLEVLGALLIRKIVSIDV